MRRDTEQIIDSHTVDFGKNGNERRRNRNALHYAIDKLVAQGDMEIDPNKKSLIVGHLAEAVLAMSLHHRDKKE
jgi:hypothetical protein